MLLQQRCLNFTVSKFGKNKFLDVCKSNRIIKRLIAYKMNSTEQQTDEASPALIAVSQMRSTNDKQVNMRQVKELVAKAKSESATFLFLPECCDFVGENRKQTLELSEPLTGNTMQQYKELAKENRIWLSLGGVHESILDQNSYKTDKIYNTHVVINDCGELAAVYRKVHRFDVVTPEFRFRESDVVAAGQRLLAPITTPVGKIGLQICYDMRFPESSLLLSKMGAQILTYPSAFTFVTGKAHWEILLRARAIENQCFVIAAAQVGFHNEKRQSWGHAMVVSPWGKILADCGNQDVELAVSTIKIDLSTIESIKRNMPCFDHRRPDVYSLTAYEAGNIFVSKDHLFANNTIKKETIFYESQHSFAFTNLCCVVPGHVLVSTKRIIPRLNGLNSEEMSDLFTTVCMIQRMLEDFYKTSSATVTVQDGPDAGQTVPHVHFHVMPRRPGDFGENDQIYTKLEERCLLKPNRDMSQRIKEAGEYRCYLQKQYETSKPNESVLKKPSQI